MAVVVVQDSVAADEEVKFLNATKRDLYKLIIDQAEIETAHELLQAVDEDTSKDFGTVKTDYLNEENDGKDAEIVEYEIEENVGSMFGDGVPELLSYDRSNSGWRVNYPTRPDAEDCSYYMKFGSCKFGLSCKFNHPPRRMNQGIKQKEYHREENFERVGQGECKYYLTSAGCRYGTDCKYSHGSDKNYKSNIGEFNFLGLPIRKGEKECPYYMRTVSCKYGLSCRFHHPEPSPMLQTDSPFGYGNGGGSLPSKLVSSPTVSSWSSPRAFNDTSPFTSAMFLPTKGVAASNTEWNRNQAATTYPTSESGLPTPPAFATDNLPTEINFSMLYHQEDMLLEEYPERPGEPECSFFLKTGDCKFKFNCKFHHPKNRISNKKAYSSALNNKDLPLRPDQPLCTFYRRFGICKYGPVCRYDHPSDFAILPPTFHQQLFGN